MKPATYIVSDSAVRLWGLTTRQRLETSLAGLGLSSPVEDLADAGAAARVLLLRGDRVYDERVLANLVGEQDVVVCDDEGIVVAANVAPQHADAAYALIADGQDTALPGVARRSARQLCSDYSEALRKLDPPYILAATPERRKLLEEHLFAGSYKGVVDFVTKWFWPWPARIATGWCVQLRLRPNHVTTFSLLLTVLTGMLFWHGELGLGLATGTLMTFLDTVDGKLARVTLTSSRFGHLLDHGIDLLHPPLWYWAWAIGVVHNGDWTTAAPTDVVLWLMLAAYIGGRAAEGMFKGVMGRVSLFIWRPFDSWNRLVTARRNPNMILLLVGLAAGRPDLGLVAVITWHLLSTAVLWTRVCQAWAARRAQGAPRSWLHGVDPSQPRNLSERIFTRPPLRVD